MPATPGSFITRHHHITIATGGAQEDYDFHTKVLGLKSVKKTAFYDGQAPIYHLYYGNDAGEESSLVTTFRGRPIPPNALPIRSRRAGHPTAHQRAESLRSNKAFSLRSR